MRYLIHFDDGGSGMGTRDQPLELAAKLVDRRWPLPGPPAAVS
jgi:hypothetical protein